MEVSKLFANAADAMVACFVLALAENEPGTYGSEPVSGNQKSTNTLMILPIITHIHMSCWIYGRILTEKK